MEKTLQLSTGLYRFILLSAAGIVLFSCNNNQPADTDIAKTPAQLEEKVTENIQTVLTYVNEHEGRLNDSVTLEWASWLLKIYEDNQYQAIWSSAEKWHSIADSLFYTLDHIKEYGLFPEDYHYKTLAHFRQQILTDSTARKNAALWTKADCLLSDAWLSIAHDLKMGRLKPDSADLRADSVASYDVLVEQFKHATASNTIIQTLHDLEPSFTAYKELRESIGNFLNDSSLFKNDSAGIAKFKRIAVTLDRYKRLPDTLPSTYVWVNIPEYNLYVYDNDTLVFKSKVIVGSPRNPTPLLHSEITNFITYPQWTVPYSIIFKEMLPKIQQNVAYLYKQNLMVVDKNDSVIDPATIDWAKLNKKYFPYLLRQRQGDDNSLGVMKFNFKNPYHVYLHDTNARGLFSRSARALSHGCVRVQEWEKLAHFLVRDDTLRYSTDTLRAWIDRQEKHMVSGFPKLPLYIRYFSCAGKEGKLKFYNDVYRSDSILASKYFAGKTID